MRAIKAGDSRSDRKEAVDADEEIRLRAVELLRKFGIEYAVWGAWTIDKVEVYVDAWMERRRQREELFLKRSQEASLKKDADSGIRFVIPFEV